MEEKIKLARYKKTPYSVRFEGKRYEWGGSKGRQYSTKEVPPEVVDYLSLNTTALKNGELVILDIESNENAKEIKIDSLTKQKILKNWIGSQLSVEELFGNQE